MEQTNPLKYLGYAIVCEEVPDEISIAINISGCKHRCDGCHSKYLWDYDGNYVKDDLPDILNKYKELVTCVCFLGGDQNIEELSSLCEFVKLNDLKTCIYSGEDSADIFKTLLNNNLIDYLKIGKFDLELGPLNSPKTNQKMYKISGGIIEDITYKFQKQFN